MSDGKGCKCWAKCSNECRCDADWTPQEIYDLRDRITALEKELAEALNLVNKLKSGEYLSSLESTWDMMEEENTRLKAQVGNLLTTLNEIRSATFLWPTGEHKERLKMIQDLAKSAIGQEKEV